MKLVELTEFLVKQVSKEPELVSVKQFQDDTDAITIQVLVSEQDMGSVIGSGGAVANAIRTLVQAAAYVADQKHVRINIDSF